MPENAVLIDKAPGGPYESEEEAASEVLPGHVMELVWNSSAGQWEVQPNEAALPGLRVAKGGFQEGLDQVYADGDGVRFFKLQSGEVALVYVYGEEDGGDAAVSEGDVLYKTALADHTAAPAGVLDVNATDGVAVAKAKEAVVSGALALIKVEKL